MELQSLRMEKSLCGELRQQKRFRCKKSDYFAKQAKTFTIRKVSNYLPLKIVHKDTNCSLKVREENFYNITFETAHDLIVLIIE